MSKQHLSCMFLLVMAVLLCHSQGCARQGPKVYDYDDFVLIGDPKFGIIISGPDGLSNDRVANIYIRFGTSTPIVLRELTLLDLRDVMRHEELIGYEVRHSEDTVSEVSFTDRGGNGFVFKDDKLVRMGFRNVPSLLSFSSSKDGPYVKFPVSEKDAVAAFGKPARVFYDKPTAAP